MTHFKTLKTAKPLDDHRVAVVFEDNTQGVFDCATYFSKPYWTKLADPEFFRTAYVEYGHLTWPGDIDISPIEVWRDSVKHSLDNHH